VEIFGLKEEDKKMQPLNAPTRVVIRNFAVPDVREVYRLLVANRPYVGLNSQYTYFLLAKDFSDTCLVAECNGRIVGFSSGYLPPARTDIFFNWEVAVEEKCRGHGLQRTLLLSQLSRSRVRFLEATVNPSNEASKKNYRALAQLLETKCLEQMLFDADAFEDGSHEAEVLFRIGPFHHSTAVRLAAAK
jgi:L-2,4-diaminobutyric acid acetyltransferase